MIFISFEICNSLSSSAALSADQSSRDLISFPSMIGLKCIGQNQSKYKYLLPNDSIEQWHWCFVSEWLLQSDFEVYFFMAVHWNLISIKRATLKRAQIEMQWFINVFKRRLLFVHFQCSFNQWTTEQAIFHFDFSLFDDWITWKV